MEKIKELLSLCKASVEISVNSHRDFYETVSQFIKEDEKSDIDPMVFDEMVKRDTIVKIQAYPRTPIGSYTIYHYDIDKAIEIAIEAVKQ